MSTPSQTSSDTATSRPGISACLIVRNEERYLPSCLASIRPWVDEICILDTGSTDRTLEIARSFHAVIGRARFQDDFSAIRNASVQLATKPWVLIINADEVLDAKSGPALHQAVTADRPAWLVTREVQTGDRFSEQLVPRLFRRRPDVFFSRPVYEDICDSLIKIGAPLPELSEVRLMHHRPAKDAAASRARTQRNLQMLRAHVLLQPGDLTAMWRLATTLSPSDEAAERLAAFTVARRLADKLLAKEKESFPFIPLIYDGLATCLVQRGELGRAIEVVKQGLSEHPGSIDLIFRMGDLGRRVGDVDTAGNHLRQCVGAPRPRSMYAGDPALRGPRPAAALALMALESGNVDGAVGTIMLALQLDPTNIDARCLNVRVLLLQNRIKEATEAAAQLMNDAPFAREVQVLGGELAWLQNQQHTAIDLWRAAIGSCDAGNDARAQLAVAELLHGNRGAMLEHLSVLNGRDLPTAACRLLLSVMGGIEAELDPAIQVKSLLRHVAFWLRELASAGRQDLLSTFMQAAPRYQERYPGIEKLVIPE